jgi:hypothetical protein
LRSVTPIDGFTSNSADPRHRREIFHRVVGHVLVQAGIDGVGGHGGEQQRVAVGRPLGDELGADIAAGAGPVLDHEGLAQNFSHLRRHDAADNVGRAAGGERNDHLHRVRWKIIRGLYGRDGKRSRGYGGGQ